MRITFDPEKNERNIRERNLSFELASKFDYDTALYLEDTRRNYGEKRMRGFGYIGNRLHVLVFTMRGETMRVISLRKANAKEVKWYEEATAQP